MDLIRDWFRRQFSDPQVAILAALLLIGFAAVILLGQMLAPVIAALVIAYLLEPPVRLLERLRWPRWAAVSAVFLAFMAGFLFLMLGLVPVLWQQSLLLFQQMPYMISAVQDLLLRLPQTYPDFVTEQQVTDLMAGLRNEIAARGQSLLTYSVASMLGLMYFGVYLIVVPMGVFFLLKDKKRILGWIADFLPQETSLAARVWREVNQQIANYVRGKVYEILIVGAVTYVVFALLGLQFALLLAALSGLAVVIPYIGAVAVTIPVALIAYFQWGWGADFAFTVAAYVVIHMLDGNALATLLASEVVNLHPIAVIAAILVFGGTFGFWGVFFAIPLATLVHAVLRAWPRIPREQRALKE